MATDMLGVSGQTILADLAKGRLREKRGELEQALRGLMGQRQRHLLTREGAQRLGPLDETVQGVDTPVNGQVRNV